MPAFLITDTKTGSKFKVTAPDMAAAQNAYKQFSDPNFLHPHDMPAYVPQSFNGPNGANTVGLAMPGTPSPPNPPPTQRFGLSSSDTINPLPAIGAFADSAVGEIPIAGPYLQGLRDKANAAAYTALGDQTTPAQSRASMDESVRQNPIPSTAGKIVGAVAPYAAGAEIPLIRGVLGFEGPALQRLAMGGLSTQVINTSDNLAHGQDPVSAATNAAKDAAINAPLSLLGKGKAATGPLADASKYLQSEGIPLTAGQQRGSRTMMTAESQLGGGATSSFQEKQLSALTSAAAKRAGVDAASLTPDILQKAYSDIGNKFDNLSNRTTIAKPAAQQLQNDALKAATDYQASVGQPAPVVENFVNRIGTLLQQNGGTLPGDNYKILVTDLRKAADGSSSTEIKGALGQIRSALDDAVESSLGGHMRDEWRTARQQYRNLIILTDAVGSGTANAAKGLITPATLAQAVSKNVSRSNYAKGYGDLNELSHSANLAMPTIPDSGTASRSLVTLGPALVTGALGHGGGLGAAAGTSAALLAPSIVGHAMLSAPGRALLSRGTNLPSVVGRGLMPMASDAISSGSMTLGQFLQNFTANPTSLGSQ